MNAGEFTRGGFVDASAVHGTMSSLRPVEADDVDLLVAWRSDDDVARYWDWEPATLASIVADLARPDVTPYLVLEGDGTPIGYLQVWQDEPDGGLDMFLEPSARGRGLGPDAARAMAQHLLRDRGWQRVAVDPYLWNEQAVRAWRKAGFVEVSRHEPDDEHTSAWMLLEFNGSISC